MNKNKSERAGWSSQRRWHLNEDLKEMTKGSITGGEHSSKGQSTGKGPEAGTWLTRLGKSRRVVW